MSRDRVGFIGLGVMGAPMSRNLLRAGYDLVVYNRSSRSAQTLASAGATVAQSPREVAASAQIIVTMLPDGPDVESVVSGDQGIFAGARPGALWIDMSTISSSVARGLADAARGHGIDALDAPVSGGDVGAEQGSLSIMVGGSEDAFERALPIFEILGKTIRRCGPSGAGQVVKACNQIVVALVIEAVSEALVLGELSGIAPEVILDVLGGGLAANRVMEVRRRNFLEHDFEPGFRVDLHRKDLRLALDTAREHGVPLPMTAAVEQMFVSLNSAGLGDRDHTSLLAFVEGLAHSQGRATARE